MADHKKVPVGELVAAKAVKAPISSFRTKKIPQDSAENSCVGIMSCFLHHLVDPKLNYLIEA